MKDKVELIYKRMGSFAGKKFYDATVIDHLEKLKQEAQEAKENQNDIIEYADCLLCVFAAANKAKFTFRELLKATEDKLLIVENRDWEKKSDGTYQHTEKKIPFDIALMKAKQAYKLNDDEYIPF